VTRRHVVYNALHERRSQNFFESTSCRTDLSKLSSATSFFNLAFSSVSCFSSQTYSNWRSPYCFFQRWKVCSEIPICRIRSATAITNVIAGSLHGVWPVWRSGTARCRFFVFLARWLCFNCGRGFSGLEYKSWRPRRRPPFRL